MSKKDTKQESEKWGTELEFHPEYTYNKDNDCYIVTLKKLNKNFVMRGEVHRAIISAYSDFLGDPSTIAELCRTHGIPRDILTEYMKIFNMTHSDLPYSKEELQDMSVEELAQDILEKKKLKVVQELNRKDWQETKILAKKFLALEAGTFNPIIDFLQSWKPTRYRPIGKPSYVDAPKNDKKHIIISLSDPHWGLYAEKETQYTKGEWNIQETTNQIQAYVTKIKAQVASFKYRPEEVTLLLMGDLLHTLTGYTDKGTKLEAHPIGAKQFEIAFECLRIFVDEILKLFKKVNVKSVQGNHSSVGDHILAMILKALYEKEPRINFELSRARWLNFKIFNSLFIIEHGYSAEYRSRLPSGRHERTSYIQSLFLAKPDKLQNIKHRYYLTADQHHSEIETNDYELIMFSTFIGGDKHSDNSNLRSRPRQNILVVGQSGVEQIINIYFD